MEIKKTFGAIFLIVGGGGLIAGILGIFEGFQLIGISPWAFAILGLVFFIAGIAVVKSINSINIE